MSVEAPLRTVASAVAIERGNPSVLEAVARPEVHLAVWTRPLPAALSWLPALDFTKIDDLDFEISLDAAEAEIAEGLAEAGYPAGDRANALLDEICGHARRFAAIQRLDAVTIRLEVIETDACRKFHADHVTARLLTTLVGSGTQWIHGIADPDTPIRQLRTGDVGIFKGRLGADPVGILHRSPPILDTGETRLLLAIDPVAALGMHA
ncbi:DUF1826 domain-containing protein [Sphingomonas sp. 22176]|uniref:DUF1826 domain-containing protein n=1 Tax=Sphingomonas sp. 22176 TaxID=3453884 RepID=UPI003F8494D8